MVYKKKHHTFLLYVPSMIERECNEIEANVVSKEVYYLGLILIYNHFKGILITISTINNIGQNIISLINELYKIMNVVMTTTIKLMK